jgi:predicted dithiol-disulfide oxidoreductase (DUF899 family)
MKTATIELPEVVTRAEWLAARLRLLAKEKELTHRRDALNTERRRLPMVRIEKDYVFEGPDGKASLLDLFEGRLQLIIYHFMWLWDAGQPRDVGCPSCSAWADEIARGHLTHLHTRGTTLALVSRAPLAKLNAFKKRMGWTLPWYSSFGSDFNYDFHVTLDESVTPLEYNYRTKAEHERAGTSYYFEREQPFDLPGLSCFLRDDGQIFHTYSTYGRGGETVGGSYYFLDLTALGRQEDWEEPKGRATGLGATAGSEKIRYPDEYEEVNA